MAIITYALPYGVASAVSGALTTTGADAYVFTLESSPVKQAHTLALYGIGVAAVPTALTVDLEFSGDGQLTWQKYATSKVLITGAAGTATVLTGVVTGVVYRINATTVTLGATATSVTVWAVAN